MSGKQCQLVYAALEIEAKLNQNTSFSDTTSSKILDLQKYSVNNINTDKDISITALIIIIRKVLFFLIKSVIC